jgi:predicted nucleotidyltransferase/HEPN domain-containing protein
LKQGEELRGFSLYSGGGTRIMLLMKKSLAHLPKHKRDELKLVTEILLDECPTVLMIILFGSYARGDWVEDSYVENGITYEYASDFDILVIVRSNRIVNSTDTWRRAEARARRFPIRTWTNLVVESIETVNNALVRGQYFFTDIKKEGVLLYDTGEFKLARRKKLNPKERRGNAKAHFEQWFESAKEFYVQFECAFGRRSYKISAFELHQATERFYDTILLVFTNYRPKSHDLEKLSHMVAGFDPALLSVFPQATDEQKQSFDLLKRAYVEARYNPGYKITKEQLEYLAERVQKLQYLTKRACTARIESYLSA